MIETVVPRPVVLCVLDGWGFRTDTRDNAIALASTPHFDRWLKQGPVSQLDASGRAVGLPAGQMGNSEVGHMSIGAGRVALMDLPRIDAAIADGTLAHNPLLADFAGKVKRVGGSVHLMGLLSPGGVHSHQNQLAAIAILLARQGLTVWVHAFLDGRDTPPKSALSFMREFLDDIAPEGAIRVATVSGRYYAMDRDQRWERVAKAYNALVDAQGESAVDPMQAIERAYGRGQSDEFVEPYVIAGYPGMKSDDGLLMGNFRADRARQILRALLKPDFTGFARPRVATFTASLGLVAYADDLDPLMPALFPPQDPKNTLGEIIAAAGLKQLRLAETEKYAHVTFFLNGGREDPFPGEARILVPSPKVATYDLKPEMSAQEVTDRLVEAIDSDAFALIVVNYANPDMVGHTGMLDAAIRAVETIDGALGRVATAVERRGGLLVITADHGNIELMRDQETHEPHTAHTTNLVPFLLVNAGCLGHRVALADGILADVAPTVLELLGLPKPAEMTGRSLLIDERAEIAQRATG